MEPNEIVGWSELEKEVGRCYNVIRRLMAFNGFPKSLRRNSNRQCVWDRQEVFTWLRENELPTSGRDQRWL